MNSQKSFTVKNPPLIFWLCICILGFFVILVSVYTIFSSSPHTGLYVCTAILVFIPGTIITLWTKMFRIEVRGTMVSARKGLGLINFNFDVSDIAKVEWKIIETKYGKNEKITVFTSKGKKISIEPIMVNSGKMIKFIEDNVDKTRIKKTYKDFTS